MNRIWPALLVFLVIGMSSCKQDNSSEGFHVPDWTAHKAAGLKTDSLRHGRTYLPVYAQIYHITQDNVTDLAATISIRNTDVNDSIFIDKIDYYNTDGKLIRKYIEAPIFLKPAETMEVVIKSSDNEGGTGANFIFNWYTKKTASKPLFESVMISTSGQQGISFTSRGVDLN